jgi:glycosyltransferase involved in cell wall biosynthesis
MGSALRVVYVTYDGALDPLGSSQVLPYLLGLAARGFEIALVSFEKRERWTNDALRTALQRRLQEAGVLWRPLRYHRRPRLPATFWDVCQGSAAISALVRRFGAKIVHCRSDVAMFMARRASLPSGVRLIYDIRGFFADERAESGSWRPGSLLDVAVRRAERANLVAADGVVVLTEAARVALSARGLALPECRVIPTCVDLASFHPRPADATPSFGLVYVGSLGSWYLTKEMVAFARVSARWIPGRTLFLTPDLHEARRAGVTDDWAELRKVDHAEVASWLRSARASLFFYAPSPSRRATSPTKLGEALASGLPVAANCGIGDLDRFLEQERVGTFVASFTDDAYRAAAGRLATLLADPSTPARCRHLAEKRLALDGGVAAYASLYEAVGRR